LIAALAAEDAAERGAIEQDQEDEEVFHVWPPGAIVLRASSRKSVLY
jgi:hypothetical protein